MSRELIAASYRGLEDLPIFRRAGGDGESPVAFSRSRQDGRVGKQGRAAGRSRVLAVDQSEANRGHAMGCRLAGSATAVKFQKCRVQFEFCHIDSRNLSGVSDLLIFAQWPFYRRIAATPEGSEESGKRGLRARDHSAHCRRMGH